MSEPVRIDNATGETPCLVRWMVETPAGWLGAWDREAFDAYTEPLRSQLADAERVLSEIANTGNGMRPADRKRLLSGFVPREMRLARDYFIAQASVSAAREGK